MWNTQMSYLRWIYRVCRSPVLLLLLLACSIICLQFSLRDGVIYSLRENHLWKAASDFETSETKRNYYKQLFHAPPPQPNANYIRQKKINSKGVLHFHTLKSSHLISPLKDRFHHDVHARPAIFSDWQYAMESQCHFTFVAYRHEFAYLHNVVVDMAYCHGSRGGELISDVLNQPEDNEYYKFGIGCFQLNCRKQPLPSYDFSLNYHLSAWMDSLKLESRKEVQHVKSGFTIAIIRYEYANLYHTMTDWYNLFLLMQYFNQTQASTNVLLVDGHPHGQLDGVWGRLVANVSRISSLQARTRFSDLVWGIPGYNSLVLQHESDELPLVEQFRVFFLASYSLPVEPRPRHDCRRFNVLFVWRRDYLAHPRNPLGRVGRKISNERELLVYARKRWPWARIHGTQLDAFHMHTQLTTISSTDVLIGMHGAGLTHAMFLPPNAALIEIKPPDWQEHQHFEAIARWRRLHYARWLNAAEENPSGYSKVPVRMIDECLGEIIQKMCGSVNA